MKPTLWERFKHAVAEMEEVEWIVLICAAGCFAMLFLIK